MTIAFGNGALFLSSESNRNLPRTNRISPFIAQSCHQPTSVLDGTKHTTNAPLHDSR